MADSQIGMFKYWFKSPWQLTTCHKAFVVSGTHIHFGCCGDQSPFGQQSKQWEPQTAVSSLLGLISVAYPLSAWTAFPFILSFHKKITLVVSGKRQQLMETVTSLMVEGSLLKDETAVCGSNCLDY